MRKEIKYDILNDCTCGKSILCCIGDMTVNKEDRNHVIKNVRQWKCMCGSNTYIKEHQVFNACFFAINAKLKEVDWEIWYKDLRKRGNAL